MLHRSNYILTRCGELTRHALFLRVEHTAGDHQLHKIDALALRAPHEQITRQVRDILRQYASDVLTLSTEACAVCRHCSYPDAPCRHPDRMFPCVESYGIVATDLAEKNGIEFYNGNLVTWFSVLCYR